MVRLGYARARPAQSARHETLDRSHHKADEPDSDSIAGGMALRLSWIVRNGLRDDRERATRSLTKRSLVSRGATMPNLICAGVVALLLPPAVHAQSLPFFTAQFLGPANH